VIFKNKVFVYCLKCYILFLKLSVQHRHLGAPPRISQLHITHFLSHRKRRVSSAICAMHCISISALLDDLLTSICLVEQCAAAIFRVSACVSQTYTITHQHTVAAGAEHDYKIPTIRYSL